MTKSNALLFSTAQLGNLLFPKDSREIGVTVLARKPLPKSQKTLTCVVRDYWGAEQMGPVGVTLAGPRMEKKRFIYEATLDLGKVPLKIGRYYEFHGEIAAEPQGGIPIEPFRNHASFAILPEAKTRQYDPMDVPFTARNWDNRIGEYIRLTDRLGIRICGLWGGWSSKPPYKPQAPGLDLCRELKMGWLTTTPIKHIERGKDNEWSEEALRQGVRNFLKAYGDERPLIINLGNEPHGTGDRVRKNVQAYRVVYQEIKKIDPTIPVVATSVEPNEEYFKNGYGQWCDAYDFHIYEHHSKVAKTMEKYRELMEKYEVVKPIWSTELGLNSQGQPRHAVSLEVIKKFATFFASGGENASWFGLLYPDREGKNHGSSGDSHNLFDCRFNRYAPRLDAITCFHAINAIAIKKFVEEKRYPNGVHAFLFRDREDRCLQILWNDNSRVDAFFPLPGVPEVELIHIDGSSAMLNAHGEGLTLGVSSDPLMLHYDDSRNGLADELGEPLVEFGSIPNTISRSEFTEIVLVAKASLESTEGITFSVPPFWEVQRSGLKFRVYPPRGTAAREGEFVVSLPEGRGEIRFRVPLGE